MSRKLTLKGKKVKQLRKGYRQKVYADILDDQGEKAPVDGVPVWSVSTSAVSVTPEADGMSAFVRGTGNTIGETGIVSVTADADLGQGVTPIIREEEYQLVSGTAAVINFRFDDPEVDPGEET